MENNKKHITVGFCDFFSSFNPEKNMFMDILQKKYTVTLSDKPSFLFYSCFGNTYKSHDCVKIFYTNEAITPNFNDCDYAIGLDFLNFGERYIRRNRAVAYNAQKAQALPQSLAQRKFCNFIYSNGASGEGAFLRQEFCKKLMQYKHVDCPGTILNNMQDAITSRHKNWSESKNAFIAHYKFTIAFENCSMAGYTTEKLTDPLKNKSIPIYWGDPKVTQDFNPKAFINCHDFKNFNDVVEYVKYLDTNDDAYMEMLRQPPMQKGYTPSDIASFLYNIIEKGSTPYDKDPRKFQEWISKTPPPHIKFSYWQGVKNILLYFYLRKKIDYLLKQEKLEEVEALAQNILYNNPYMLWTIEVLSQVYTLRRKKNIAINTYTITS